MGRRKKSIKPGESLRTRKGKASTGFAAIVVLSLITGGVYLQVTDQWGAITSAAGYRYSEFVEEVVNDPGKEAMRAKLLERVIEHYKETPARKSLPLRNDDGHVVGRFRIDVADVDQPHQGSKDAALRRIYTVDLSGSGELWHETGGRVRFTGTAFVTYHVDFKVKDWAAYAYFECVEIENARFECTHIDNILGQIFSGVVRRAGTEALTESFQAGFTVIARANGDTYLAAGEVGPEFTPRKGPNEEHDKDDGFETITNDVTLLHAGYRDYLGPIELFDGSELRITMESESLEPAKSFGMDVYILTEKQFEHFEAFYPGDMRSLRKLDSIEQRIDMQKLNMTREDLAGNIYILIDNTGWGSGKDPDNRAGAGLVKYYVRARR